MHLFGSNGALVKKVVDSVTTIYVGNHYEKNITTGVATSYYYAGGRRVAMRQGGVVYYLLGDHLGSTALTVNSSGSKVAELRYKAWGETRYTWGTTPTTYRYTGQRQEESLGLYQMGARWYDPALSRWLSADTLVPEAENSQALNRYSYVYNNPLRYVDPTGHFSDEELAVLFGFVDADGNPDLKAMYASALWASFADDFKAMLGAARFGDILVGAGAEWEGGRQVSWQGQAMFVKTAEGRLALWDLGSKTEASLSKFSGADRWVLFQSGKEKGFGDYKRTNYYRGSQDLPAPSLSKDWTEGANNFIDINLKLKWGKMAVEAAGIVVGGAMVIVSWPASAVDPEPITKVLLTSGAAALTVSVAQMVVDVAEGNWIEGRIPTLNNGPRPDLMSNDNYSLP